MEIHLAKNLLVNITLQEGAAREAKRLGDELILDGVVICTSASCHIIPDFAPEFYRTICSTETGLPQRILDLIKEIRWAERLYDATRPQRPLRLAPGIIDGTYRQGDAVATVTDLGLAYEERVEIKSRTVKSLVGMFAKLFPDTVLPDRKLPEAS